MTSNRRTDTAPERALRSILYRRGLRFRKDHRVDLVDRRVRVDIAFPRRRLAVFVDGCFWHRCPEHATDPITNGGFWHEKLRRNVDRDCSVNLSLRLGGWMVLRFWEHADPVDAAQAVVETLRARAAEA